MSKDIIYIAAPGESALRAGARSALARLGCLGETKVPECLPHVFSKGTYVFNRYSTKKMLNDAYMFNQFMFNIPSKETILITLIGERHGLEHLCDKNPIDIDRYVMNRLESNPNTVVLLEISDSMKSQKKPVKSKPICKLLSNEMYKDRMVSYDPRPEILGKKNNKKLYQHKSQLSKDVFLLNILLHPKIFIQNFVYPFFSKESVQKYESRSSHYLSPSTKFNISPENVDSKVYHYLHDKFFPNVQKRFTLLLKKLEEGIPNSQYFKKKYKIWYKYLIRCEKEIFVKPEYYFCLTKIDSILKWLKKNFPDLYENAEYISLEIKKLWADIPNFFVINFLFKKNTIYNEIILIGGIYHTSKINKILSGFTQDFEGAHEEELKVYKDENYPCINLYQTFYLSNSKIAEFL